MKNLIVWMTLVLSGLQAKAACEFTVNPGLINGMARTPVEVEALAAGYGNLQAGSEMLVVYANKNIILKIESISIPNGQSICSQNTRITLSDGKKYGMVDLIPVNRQGTLAFGSGDVIEAKQGDEVSVINNFWPIGPKERVKVIDAITFDGYIVTKDRKVISPMFVNSLTQK